jgi:hypothetical protein
MLIKCATIDESDIEWWYHMELEIGSITDIVTWSC